MTRYFASAVDLGKTVCFLLFQHTKLPPRNVQYPVVENNIRLKITKVRLDDSFGGKSIENSNIIRKIENNIISYSIVDDNIWLKSRIPLLKNPSFELLFGRRSHVINKLQGRDKWTCVAEEENKQNKESVGRV